MNMQSVPRKIKRKRFFREFIACAIILLLFSSILWILVYLNGKW
mgnify:CR=1 FL=1